MDVKIAVIGAGVWGKNLVRNFHQLGCLHAVCDTSSTAFQETMAAFPKVSVCSDFNDILQDSAVDAVVIATPAQTHFELAKQALLHNKDVFVEKPLALNAYEGEVLAKLAHEQNRILMVGHLLQYHPAVVVLKQLVNNGSLGKLRYISSSRLSSRRALQEGGVLWDLAPHDISLVLSLLGEFPTGLSAASTSNASSNLKSTVVSHLSFPGGASVDIFASWLYPFKEQKLVVIGDKQVAIFDDTLPWQEKLMLYPHEITKSEQALQSGRTGGTAVALVPAEPLRVECEHFISCIQKRVYPLTDVKEGIRVLKILDALQASLDQIDAQVQQGKNDNVYDTYPQVDDTIISEEVLRLRALCV
jgi:UDP-2-acetamido-3-amino-2,3-dideoxy-glucuronate N-acetyltransferase